MTRHKRIWPLIGSDQGFGSVELAGGTIVCSTSIEVHMEGHLIERYNLSLDDP